ncbi:MAG TPA: LuxR C-terminal-related transcriptional regulator [Gammaproteobacteria bacterium]|nr:LuxR C-terminal-related transcriptional regulator [Gammaproteobacteria bacterium]
MDFWQKAVLETTQPSTPPPKSTRPKTSEYRYKLNQLGEGLYLSRRETQCIYWSLKGQTLKEVGDTLKLSPRTIEFYFKRIKDRFKIKKKKDLLDTIKGAGFEPTSLEIIQKST